MLSRPKTARDGEPEPEARSGRAALESLLVDCAGGDHGAFERLYRLTAPQLFGLAIRMLGDRGRAEEVVQEVFVEVWNGARKYDPAKGTPLTWLASITRYRAIDMLRRRRPEVPIDENTAERDRSGPDPLEMLEQGVEGDRLRQCLEELEQAARDGIVMAYCYGYTNREIAARLEAPLGTVKSWLRRGLARLKGCLEP